MTNPRSAGVDPQLVARLSGQFAALGEHLRQVSGELGQLHSQLAAQQAPMFPAQPQQFAQPQPQPQPQPFAQPQQFAQPRQFPRPPQPVPAQPVPPRPAAPRKEPWWQRDGVISRLLAIAGAGVTLIGIVMLLVLAAQAGWFGPELRVGAGAAFSSALVYIGSRIFGRSGGRVGGIAVAATGVAGLYLDVVAVTVIYDWLEPALGLAAAFGIAAAGIALAVSWRSQPMAALILTGVAVCAPVVSGGITLSVIGFFAVTFIATFPAQLGRDWPLLNVARTLPIVAATLLGIAEASSAGVGIGDAVTLLIVASVVAAFGLGSSLELLRRNAADTMASMMMALGVLPILLVGNLFERWTLALVELLVAVTCAATIALARWLPVHARIVLSLVGAAALLQAVVVPTAVELRPLTLLAVAAAALVLAQKISSKIAYFLGGAFAALGTIGFVVVAPVDGLMDADYAAGHFGVVVAGLLLVAVAAGLVLVAVQLGIVEQNVQSCWVFAGVVSLYGLTSATVALGVGAIGGTTGFIAGHCAATIGWMAVAMALLIMGLRSEKYAHTALLAGLSLTAAAVAKLFLFDLVALDGLFRVGAFIVVGLLLLFAGTRYAKVFADREAEQV
ncbi:MULTISPECIES: DUF2339 domain-containing protein [unclassified Rhodococcus (in: high G+C Gram-positive bacteria)]|uniref:DUF2339 domain-containing protein n=1 Tax=unclassified Rhodococcus (in: high G+C Gram-positive bacteria) TaxID=192944 RepID=UPI001B3543B2|nr:MULTISPECIES: DUF2339 domain-containing protein [unclassified Rhodococcus (in: high G+C Gram-positive bacteria)]